MVEGASRSHRFQHCDHAGGKQGRFRSLASCFHRGCQSIRRERKHLLHWNLSSRVHKRRKCLHRSANSDISCCEQEGSWDRRRSCNCAKGTDHQCRERWCISYKNRWLLLSIDWRNKKRQMFFFLKYFPISMQPWCLQFYHPPSS